VGEVCFLCARLLCRSSGLRASSLRLTSKCCLQSRLLEKLRGRRNQKSSRVVERSELCFLNVMAKGGWHWQSFRPSTGYPFQCLSVTPAVSGWLSRGE
jgi:hypothetical protein